MLKYNSEMNKSWRLQNYYIYSPIKCKRAEAKELFYVFPGNLLLGLVADLRTGRQKKARFRSEGGSLSW